MSLTGKTAIVTGASRGIGEATAWHLASLSATVVLVARSAERIHDIATAINNRGGHSIAIPCDVSRPGDVQMLIEKSKGRTGRVDILVNNAAVIDPLARLGDSDPCAWGQIVDINLKGVYHCLRYAIPVMSAQGSGTIVNISSRAATGRHEGWSHYCATKAAVLSLTRVADAEYRSHGIRVMGLNPGTVATRMQDLIRASGLVPVSPGGAAPHITPEDVAQAIAWLCTTDADAHRGMDFCLNTEPGRIAVGLPPICVKERWAPVVD